MTRAIRYSSRPEGRQTCPAVKSSLAASLISISCCGGMSSTLFFEFISFTAKANRVNRKILSREERDAIVLAEAPLRRAYLTSDSTGAYCPKTNFHCSSCYHPLTFVTTWSNRGSPFRRTILARLAKARGEKPFSGERASVRGFTAVVEICSSWATLLLLLCSTLRSRLSRVLTMLVYFLTRPLSTRSSFPSTASSCSASFRASYGIDNSYLKACRKDSCC